MSKNIITQIKTNAIIELDPKSEAYQQRFNENGYPVLFCTGCQRITFTAENDEVTKCSHCGAPKNYLKESTIIETKPRSYFDLKSFSTDNLGRTESVLLKSLQDPFYFGRIFENVVEMSLVIGAIMSRHSDVVEDRAEIMSNVLDWAQEFETRYPEDLDGEYPEHIAAFISEKMCAHYDALDVSKVFEKIRMLIVIREGLCEKVLSNVENYVHSVVDYDIDPSDFDSVDEASEYIQSKMKWLQA